jgi:hypothetical protein
LCPITQVRSPCKFTTTTRWGGGAYWASPDMRNPPPLPLSPHSMQLAELKDLIEQPVLAEDGHTYGECIDMSARRPDQSSNFFRCKLPQLYTFLPPPPPPPPPPIIKLPMLRKICDPPLVRIGEST